jgi:hypothetical protein
MNKQTLATVSVSFFVDSVAEGEKKYEDIKNVVNAYSTSLLQFSETTLPNLKKEEPKEDEYEDRYYFSKEKYVAAELLSGKSLSEVINHLEINRWPHQCDGKEFIRDNSYQSGIGHLFKQKNGCYDAKEAWLVKKSVKKGG